MIYRNFQDKSLSLLGFGTMRLPLLPDGSVDAVQTEAMTAYAIEHGVNYFDTAYPYHNGTSETVIGNILKKYPRESFYLADKYPGHQISETYYPQEIFEDQLKKCQVDYFDFYLLHNVYENSIQVYKDAKWGILDYFKEQKRLGRIKHLGFSSHGGVENLKEFLDYCGDDMEFCQIQLNYLDWTLQEAKEKYELLTQRNIPVWVMEPVRGGKLVHLPENAAAKLKEQRPEESIAAWGFRFLQQLPNVTMILSGMSDMEQMQDNIHTFEKEKALSEAENTLLLELAEEMKHTIPCTACRYCCDECPQELNIPLLLSTYNELRVIATTNAAMRLDALGEDKLPSACIKCGNCTHVCPQKIDVPTILEELTEVLKKIPKWADICKERAAAAAALKEK